MRSTTSPTQLFIPYPNFVTFMVLEEVNLVLGVVAVLIAVAVFLLTLRPLQKLLKGMEALHTVVGGQERRLDSLQRQRGEVIKQKESEQAWRVLTGLAKAFGWAYDRGLFDEDEQEWDE